MDDKVIQAYLDELRSGGESVVRRFVETEVKAVNEDERSVLHLITTPRRDRAGDIVSAPGAYLKNFRKNPVVVADHDYSIASVIGKSLQLSVEKDAISSRTQFRKTELAEAAFQLEKEGLGGWSIGFAPMKAHSLREGAENGCPVCEGELAVKNASQWGVHFDKWELLEYSKVAIPMNPDIVQGVVARGLVPEALVPKFFNVSTDDPTPPDSEEETASISSTAEEVVVPIREPLADAGKIRQMADPVLRRIRRRIERREAIESAEKILKR